METKTILVIATVFIVLLLAAITTTQVYAVPTVAKLCKSMVGSGSPYCRGYDWGTMFLWGTHYSECSPTNDTNYCQGFRDALVSNPSVKCLKQKEQSAFCHGYHKGMVQRGNDYGYEKPNQGYKTPVCPSGHTKEYCKGYVKGYEDQDNALA